MPLFSRPPFDVTWIEREEEVRLVLRGELDLATVPALSGAIEQAEAAAARTLVLDAAELTFIDASGVRVLIAAAGRARRAGRRLTLQNPRPPVARMLRLVGVNDLLEVVDAATPG